MNAVREKRGRAYGIDFDPVTLDHAGAIWGGAQTVNGKAAILAVGKPAEADGQSARGGVNLHASTLLKRVKRLKERAFIACAGQCDSAFRVSPV